MKIIQTPVRFFPFIGGVEKYVHYLSRELVKSGHEVKVICANEPRSLFNEEMIDGISVKRLAYVSKISQTNITLKLPHELLKENFDVIHSHLPTPWSADWSALVSKIKRKPFVLTYHNDITGKDAVYYVSKLYNSSLLSFTLKTAKRIIVSHAKYALFSPYLNEYKDKIAIIPPGVDTEKFRPLKVDDKNENVVFFLSVLDETHRYKGLYYLIRALELVKREIPNVELIIGGGGKLLQEYKRLATLIHLKDNVTFTGFIPDSKIVEYYNKCDVFVLPSVSAVQEGFGMVLLEALACGKPVICTEVAGVSEDVKNGCLGRVVKPKDIRSQAKAIIEMLQDKKRAAKMGENGRKLVEKKYNWKLSAKLTEKVYESLI